MQQYTNFFFMMCVLIVGRIKKVNSGIIAVVRKVAK